MKLNILLLVCTLIASTSAQTEEVVVISGHPEWPPSWQKGDEIIGVGPELLELIFNDLGIKVQSTYTGNWKRVQEEARVGRIDVIVALYKTSKRKQFFVYPYTPFASNRSVIWAAKGKPFSFNTWDDLINLQGGVLLGESYGSSFDSYIENKLTVSRVNSMGQIFGMLIKGRIDYFPMGLYAGKINIKKYGFENKIEHFATHLNQNDVFFAFSSKSKFVSYLDEIEKRFRDYKNNGMVDKLIEKNINLAITQQAQ